MQLDALQLLVKEINKNRNAQSLQQHLMDGLMNCLTLEEKRQIVRIVIRTKNVSKRTSIDNYILAKCSTSYRYFDEILGDKGEKALFQVCKHLHYCKFNQGQYIYQIGDAADKFYVLSSGKISVRIPQIVRFIENQQEKSTQVMMDVAQLSPGDVFGQTTLKDKAKRAVETYCLEDCELFEIKKKDYEKIIKYLAISQMRARFIFLQDIEIFSKLQQTNFQSVLYSLILKPVNIGHILFRQSEEVDYVYIVKSGQFRLQKAASVQEINDEFERLKMSRHRKKRCSIFVVGTRQVLGDTQLFSSGLRNYSCTCITQKAQLYAIPRKTFETKIKEGQKNEMQGILECVISKQSYFKKREDAYRKTQKFLIKTAQPFLDHRRWSQEQTKIMNRSILLGIGIQDEQDKNSLRRSVSIRSGQKERMEEYSKQKLRSAKKIPLSVLMVSDIVSKKRKYSTIKGPCYKQAFELSPTLPTYFRVKISKSKNSQKSQTETIYQKSMAQSWYK